ncbi:M23 family metallopeptidase [Streptacidiphilus sp. EB129]|uniref:M23 family metallopeptidase n=1 Tax=Streptacidiphilus sp. EB129 TaxID=3156262 RepID=UPI003511CCAD
MKRQTPPADAVTEALAAAFGAAELSPEAVSPGLLARVPLDRLQATIDGLRERHGPVRAVRRHRELYQLRFSRGTELVWAQLDLDGRLSTLVTGPGALTARAEGVPTQGRMPVAESLRALPPPATPDAPSAAAAGPRCAAAALALRRLVGAYLAAATAAALLPYLTGTATGWLLLTAVTSVLAWYARTCGPTHALPPWFRALPLAAAALAVLAGLRALPLLGPGLPWDVPGLPELALFLAVSGLACWTLPRVRPVRPAPSAYPLTLRSPLRGGCFAATEGGGPALNRYAQESLTPGAGRTRRYAVDLVQLGEGAQWRGRRALGLAPAVNERYAIFGHPVLSPVDGVVVAAVDGLPDHPPGMPSVDHPEGNHVAIDTGRAVIVLSRLRHDSVQVRRGQHVGAGTPVGAVGNSGDGTEPGLHLRAETRTSSGAPGGVGDGVGLPFRLSELRRPPHRGSRFTLPD